MAYFSKNDAEVSRKVAAALMECAAEVDKARKVPVYVLVGATSSTGDAVGPLVGWFLRRKGFAGEFVGDLADPVHAQNIPEKVNQAWTRAMKRNKHPYIVGVDAAVGYIGRISVEAEPLKPGAGMNKQLQSVGEARIMCGTASTSLTIWCTDLNDTMTMAEQVADAIIEFDAKWHEELGRSA